MKVRLACNDRQLQSVIEMIYIGLVNADIYPIPRIGKRRFLALRVLQSRNKLSSPLKDFRVPKIDLGLDLVFDHEPKIPVGRTRCWSLNARSMPGHSTKHWTHCKTWIDRVRLNSVHTLISIRPVTSIFRTLEWDLHDDPRLRYSDRWNEMRGPRTSCPLMCFSLETPTTMNCLPWQWLDCDSCDRAFPVFNRVQYRQLLVRMNPILFLHGIVLNEDKRKLSWG
jgi:hypothetical protein